MKNPSLKSRVLGALVGFAIGDAMGATTEFMTQREIRHKYGHVSRILGGGWLNLSPGEVTDDTQMMLCVARAYVQKQQTPFEEGCCEEFVKWYRSNPKDVGNACARAIVRNEGRPAESWKNTSMASQQIAHRKDLGNGSLMRALFPCLVLDTPAAISQGQLTHNNKTCDDAIHLYGSVLEEILTNNFGIDARADIMRSPMKPTGNVINTIHNALYWLCTSSSFYSAVTSAVNHGGDADTIAAITGSLAGARFGYSNIPINWVNALNCNVREQINCYFEAAWGILKEGSNA